MSVDGICITMPVYNEAEGIVDFLNEIDSAFAKTKCKIIVINDNSNDLTLELLSEVKNMGVELSIVSNSKNLGHGPSTLKGLNLACSEKITYIMSTDGDGQITGKDLFMIYSKHLSNEVDIVEGIRINRKEPLHRYLISKITTLLVFLASRNWPKDANTPIRCYKKNSLELILKKIDKSNPIPNMFISAVSRNEEFRILESDVSWGHRKGKNSIGSSWSKKNKIFPSVNLIIFCSKSIKYWFKNING